MRFSVYALLRLSIIGFLSLSAFSVAVVRISKNPMEGLVIDHRQPWTVAQHVIDPAKRKNLILETGRDRSVPIEFGRNLTTDLLSVSPFANGKGEREMVGRQQEVSGEGSELMAVKLEMARYRYPDGELIESRETDWMPSSLPAWDVRVDRGLKTVFSTGAGYLVRLDWTDEKGLSVPHRGERIEWAVASPLGEQMSIGEPVWMTDPRYPDRLVVSFWGEDESTGDFKVGLAWVELDAARRSIVNYGIMTQTNLGQNKNGVSLRCPSLRTDDNGVTHVLWMEREDGAQPWKLLKSSIVDSRDERTGASRWGLGLTSIVAADCLPVPGRIDESLDYAYFVVPNSRSCYDGGQWRKARLSDGAGFVAFGPSHSGLATEQSNIRR